MRRVWNLEWTTAGCTVMRSCEKLLMTANSGKKRLMDSPEFSFKLLNKRECTSLYSFMIYSYTVLQRQLLHFWFCVPRSPGQTLLTSQQMQTCAGLKTNKQSHWWRHKTKQSAHPEMCTSIWSSTSSILVSSGGVSYLTLALANTQHRPRREP